VMVGAAVGTREGTGTGEATGEATGEGKYGLTLSRGRAGVAVVQTGQCGAEGMMYH
jgi:hypothetical protein